MSQKIWVPRPATKLYGTGGQEPESIRDQFVKQYGEDTVTKCEISVVLDVVMMTGMMKPPEFVDLMSKKLYRTDEKRKQAAGLESDT